MPRTMIDLCTATWNLWCDRDAEWRHDTLYLPHEVDLSNLPNNPPTIGWDALETLLANSEEVKAVELPSTVEAHFWGTFGYRPYDQTEYFLADSDPDVENGNYLGVSWWWRSFQVPEDLKGQHLILKFRGARLRAEIYLNRQLVGYDLIGETPFEVDVTEAIRHGKENMLAVRITNPGGRLDWVDMAMPDRIEPGTWGNYVIPTSHGFGGLDAGIELIATDSVYIRDVFVRNKPEITEATFQITVHNSSANLQRGNLHLSVQDDAGNTIWEHKTEANTVRFYPGKNELYYPAVLSEAQRWTLENPQLYTLTVHINGDPNFSDAVTQHFGLRWFEARGIGEKAHLYLNGKRVVLRTAIGWHFWAENGLFPTEEMATKHIKSAQALGLNMLNFHRNIANPIVLDKHDELGLLSYEESGGGIFCWYEDDFAQAYAKEKIRRMILRDRNHPSLVIFVLQNEQVALEAQHPIMKSVMAMMKELDPTRIIVNKSSWATGDINHNNLNATFRDDYAYFLPYDDCYYHDDGSSWCGWWDNHTVEGPTIYRDSLYKGPEDFSHHSNLKDRIVYWGEAMPSPAIDDLEAIKAFYDARPAINDYTRRDHLRLYEAYERYLQDKGFHGAFPTVGALTKSTGDKTYYYWGRLFENIRISNAVDGIAVNGWETNFVECACGLVDVFRNLKGDPSIVRYYTRPLHLALKSHHLVLEKGQSLITDVHLVNEVDLQGEAQIYFWVKNSQGTTVYEATFNVRVSGGDLYGELLKAGITTDVYEQAGYYTLQASLSIDEEVLVDGQEQILVVDWSSVQLPSGGAILESGDHLQTFLNQHKKLDLPTYTPEANRLDYIVMGATFEFKEEVTEQMIDERFLTNESFIDYTRVSLHITPDLLERVQAGTTLILLADDPLVAQVWTRELKEAGVMQFERMVGPAHGVWTGSWFFVKEHPLFESLPQKTVFNWEYQADPRGRDGEWFSTVDLYGGDGMVLNGQNVEHIVGYSRDHDRRIGTALAVVKHGEGQIIISTIAGLYSSLTNTSGIHTAVARRLITNMIKATQV